MRRLTFPVAMPDNLHHKDEVLSFTATHDDLRSLGAPGFIEGDSYATAGGRDLFWAFETKAGLRFQLQWAESYSICTVTADPPDRDATASALRALGLGGLRFDFVPGPEARTRESGWTTGVVWVFAPSERHLPPALFSHKQLADAWLAQTRSSGTLYASLFGESRYELMKRFPHAEDLPPPGSREAQRLIGTTGELYEYREGKQLEHRNRWQLWRQYGHGSRVMLARFEERSEAEAARDRLASLGGPMTHEVLPEEALRAPEPEVPPIKQTHSRDTQRAAWVFTPERAHRPTAVFVNKPSADVWLTRNAGSGILQLQSVNEPGPQEFIETSRERYKYREGRQLESWERWRLWRQDDQGNHFIMAEFDERDEADAEMEKMERRGHKQMYWVAPRLTT